MQKHPVLEPCCSFLGPILPIILSSIILQKSLFTVLSSVIALQLLHVFKSPSFGTLIITPIFKSLANTSSCQILINSGNTRNMSADVCASTITYLLFRNLINFRCFIVLFFRLFIATTSFSMWGSSVFIFNSIILSFSSLFIFNSYFFKMLYPS
jgi:hypothetical protein